MKPVFGIDVTKNKKNDVGNERSFICQQISQTNLESLDRITEENSKISKKMLLPLPLRIFQGIVMVVGIILFRVSLNLTRDGVTLSEMLKTVPWVPLGILACSGIFSGILMLANAKRKKIAESEENLVVSNRIDVVCSNIYSEFGVDENTPEVDILSFRYKTRKSENVFVTNSLSPVNASNLAHKFYVSDGNLYLVSLEAKYCIPLDNVTGIKTVKKQAAIPEAMWNKAIHFTEGYFEQFKIRCNDGIIHIRPYHILCFNHNGEEWGLYFPCYELPLFENITGLKAE